MPAQSCLLIIIIFTQLGFIFPNVAFQTADEYNVFISIVQEAPSIDPNILSILGLFKTFFPHQ